MSIFDIMMELPVFQGISQSQLTDLIEKIPFHFVHYEDGEVILKQGDVCDGITFVLSGQVRIVTPTYADKITVNQIFEAPCTVPFFNMFGADIHQHDTLIALGHVGIMKLDKQNLLRALQCNSILLINMLNMLSTHAQKHHNVMEYSGMADPTLRLASWLLSITDRAAQDILVDASPSDWCSMLQMDEQTFWRSVAVLEGENIVEVVGGMLKLTDRYALKTFISKKTTQNT